MKTTEEQFRDITGYEGLYKVSNHGHVYRVNHVQLEEGVYAPVLNRLKPRRNNAYLYVNLCMNGRQKNFRINRLVAEHFIPNPLNKPQVDHINGIKHDNHVDNLRWVTQSENMVGRKHNRYDERFKDQVKSMARKMSLMEIHKELNIPLRTIQIWVKPITQYKKDLEQFKAEMMKLIKEL